MHTPAAAALAFLPFAAAIGFWVTWSDLARMRIPNAAVLALLAVFLLVGPFVLPLADWGWRWLGFAVVLAIGFVLNLGGILGGGDAKFFAAIAPFVAAADAAFFMVLLAVTMIAAYVGHRAFRAVPAVRRAAPDWQSWDAGKKFPMGVPLALSLVIYLALAAFA
ncbi:MAG: prepilin peptidase [Rhodobacteraceae bacterium]|nr:prepilin peptidase [Paracoccaceae bacterium]